MSYTYTDKIKFAYTPNFDAFGRLRMSNPLTLFDSSHRFNDNGLFATQLTGSASVTFNSNQGLVELNIGTASGDEILRETYRAFAYQPGKSLLVLNTFVFEEPKANLRQRCGYFYSNGLYLELDGQDLYFVKKSTVSGMTVETKISQTNWSVDTMGGTGPSGLTLDMTKAQVLWMDFEWLGVGSVRCGFVINGEFYTCHVFHHANIIDSTYISTACLPVRYEITNTGTASTPSTLKQICTSVISEGGYELRGTPYSVSIPITTPKTLSVAGTYYPIVSIRLKPANLEGIAIPTGISLLPTSAGNYSYRLVLGGTTSGGSWASYSNSIVEYNITGTSITGGRIAQQGFVVASNQTSQSIELSRDDIFRFQLERNTFTNTALEFTLCVASDGASDTIYGAVDWQEITR